MSDYRSGVFTLRFSAFINVVLPLTHLICRGYSQEAPTKQIVALLGDDVVLPCFLKTPVDVSQLQLEWARTDLTPGFIYVWEKNKENVDDKQPSYVGRTSLSFDKLNHGDISLTLSKVQLSDEGLYRCFIPQLGQRSYVYLIVASASTPVIKVMSVISSRVVLQCESAGWYPEPELLWLDGEGNLLSAGPTETLRGPDDLYTVSSRVTVEKRHSNNITCRVQQRNTNQSRETHKHVPEDFFDIPSSSPSVTDTSPVSLALCIILLILSVVVLVRRKKKYMMRTNRRPKDQTEDVQVPTEEDREKEQFNMKLPITSRQQLQEEQQRREDAENTLGDLQNDKEKLGNELQDEKKRNEEQEAKLKELEKKKTDIISQLQQEKETLEELKKQLETKNGAF